MDLCVKSGGRIYGDSINYNIYSVPSPLLCVVKEIIKMDKIGKMLAKLKPPPPEVCTAFIRRRDTGFVATYGIVAGTPSRYKRVEDEYPTLDAALQGMHAIIDQCSNRSNKPSVIFDDMYVSDSEFMKDGGNVDNYSPRLGGDGDVEGSRDFPPLTN